jgi:hypothetical protein
MRDLFKWIDRIAAVITVATFAYSILHFLGAVPVPRFDLVGAQSLFLAVVAYEVVMAIAVSGSSALLYRWTGAVYGAMVIPIVVWAFINVEAMKTLFGDTVWGSASHGWWIFRTQRGQDMTAFGLSLVGAGLFLAIFGLLYVRRAAFDKYHQGDDASRQLAQTHMWLLLLSAVVLAFLAHAGWIWLGALHPASPQVPFSTSTQ